MTGGDERAAHLAFGDGHPAHHEVGAMHPAGETPAAIHEPAALDPFGPCTGDPGRTDMCVRVGETDFVLRFGGEHRERHRAGHPGCRTPGGGGAAVPELPDNMPEGAVILFETAVTRGPQRACEL